MRRLIPLVAAFAINLAFIAGFGAMTHTPAGGPDVVDLQLSMSPGVFKQIVDLWGPGTVAAVRQSIWLLDFLFPIAYAFLFSRLYRSLSETGGDATDLGVEGRLGGSKLGDECGCFGTL